MNKVWIGFKAIVAIWVLILLFGHFLGWDINWILIPFLLLGIGAIHTLWDIAKPAKSFMLAVTEYTLLVICIALTFYTFGYHSILGIYHDPGAVERTPWGALRVFGPILVLISGGVYFALTTQSRVLPKYIIAACMILSAGGLLVFNLVTEVDKWFTVKNQAVVEDFNVDRINIMQELGLWVRPLSSEVKAYRENDKLYFDAVNKNLSPDKLYPYLENKGTKKDGAYELIAILLPDARGEFTARAEMAWVRLKEVAIVRERQKNFRIIARDDVTWEVEFFNDQPARVLEVWERGVGLVFACNDRRKPKEIFANGQVHDLWLGQRLVATENRPLDIKHVRGGKITITFQ